MLVRERQRLTNGVIEVIDTNRSEQCPAKPRFDAQHEDLEVRIAHPDTGLVWVASQGAGVVTTLEPTTK